MGRIVEIQVKDNLKNTTYLLLVVLGISIMFYLFQKQMEVYKNIPQLSFMYVYMLIYPSISLYIVTLAATVANTSIIEKASGRIEYYLANRVKLKNIYKSYNRSVFILGMIPVVLFNITVFIYCTIFNEFLPFELLGNLRGLMMNLLAILLLYQITGLLNNIVMLTKNPENTRTAIMIISFGILYALSLATSYIAKIQGLDPSSLILWAINIFLVANVIIILTNGILHKKLRNETVVLSIKL